VIGRALLAYSIFNWDELAPCPPGRNRDEPADALARIRAVGLASGPEWGVPGVICAAPVPRPDRLAVAAIAVSDVGDREDPGAIGAAGGVRGRGGAAYLSVGRDRRA